MLDHEYAVLGGINRSRVGRYLFAFSALISTAAVAGIVAISTLLRNFGINEGLPHAFVSLAGVSTIYLLLYFIFDRFAWRLPWVGRILKVPDISGEWQVSGRSLNPDKTVMSEWSGTITIRQTWDKIRLRLQTGQSGSNSLAAALQWDDIDGYRLLYHYTNDPHAEAADLAPHHGFAELVFSTNQTSAKGEYFNGRGRNTFGIMTLSR